ncbi:MAG: hypothetical protein WCC25_07275 [Candidatus Korobacteraceae bacterium]
MLVKEVKPRWLHHLVRLAAWTIGSLLVLYVVALCEKRYEARRAIRAYNQALTVRLGDSVAELNRKLPDCKFGKAGDYDCFVTPITWRIEAPFDWYMMHAHEEAYIWQSIHRQRIGLRDWYLHVWGTVREGRVSEMDAQFFVVGRDMMLGCSWGLTPQIPRASLDIDSAAQTKLNTALNVTHITSNWVGWGYRMEFTPQSDAHDLRMREINDSCLTSFTGCRDSRELLPNLPPPDHPRYW